MPRPTPIRCAAKARKKRPDLFHERPWIEVIHNADTKVLNLKHTTGFVCFRNLGKSIGGGVASWADKRRWIYSGAGKSCPHSKCPKSLVDQIPAHTMFPEKQILAASSSRFPTLRFLLRLRRSGREVCK